MLIHTIVLIHDCTLVYCGAIEHNWKNEDFFKEELNRSWIEPKSFWRKIGQRYGITDNSQNYRKTENFRIFKIRVLEQRWWKAEEKKLHFHHRKTEHKICVLKHTWVSRKLYRLIFLEIQRIKGHVLYGSGILSFDRSQVIWSWFFIKPIFRLGYFVAVQVYFSCVIRTIDIYTLGKHCRTATLWSQLWNQDQPRLNQIYHLKS